VIILHSVLGVGRGQQVFTYFFNSSYDCVSQWLGIGAQQKVNKRAFEVTYSLAVSWRCRELYRERFYLQTYLVFVSGVCCYFLTTLAVVGFLLRHQIKGCFSVICSGKPCLMWVG